MYVTRGRQPHALHRKTDFKKNYERTTNTAEMELNAI